MAQSDKLAYNKLTQDACNNMYAYARRKRFINNAFSSLSKTLKANLYIFGKQKGVDFNSISKSEFDALLSDYVRSKGK